MADKKVTCSLKNKHYAHFTVYDDKGQIVEKKLLSTKINTRWESTAKKYDLSIEDLENALSEELNKSDKEQEEEEPLVILVRGTLQTKSQAAKFESLEPMTAFREALDSIEKGDYQLSSQNMSKLSFLRVQFKENAGIDKIFGCHDLFELTKLNPKPSACWYTHRGNVVAAYQAQAEFTAQEIASMGALGALELWGGCKVAVVSSVTHPKSIRWNDKEEIKFSELKFMNQSLLGALKYWRGGTHDEATTEDIQFWLSKRGMEIGGRYPHEFCPIDPSRSSKNQGSPPVCITADGVKCWSCKGAGHKSGGFISWSKLVGGFERPLLVEAAKNFVPWSHVKYIVQSSYGSNLPSSIASQCYLSLCKLVSSTLDDPRINKVLNPDINCVRILGGQWAEAGNLNPCKVGDKALAEFPCCQKLLGNMEEGYKSYADPVVVDRYANQSELKGWPEIYPVRGSLIYHEMLPFTKYRNAIISQIKPENFKDLPKYLRPKKRIPISEVREQLYKLFPRINLDYLELLIVSRGIIEGSHRAPWFLVTGPSGSGKTKTVEIAAQIVGDSTARVQYSFHRFRQDFAEAAIRNGYVILDEFAKKRNPANAAAQFDKMLELDGGYYYHRPHVGTINFTLNSVTIVTNTHYPKEVLENKQIGRRMVAVHLEREAPGWDLITKIEDLRNNYKELCDSYLSYIIDTHFCVSFYQSDRDKGIHLMDKAVQLGFDSLSNTMASRDQDERDPNNIDMLIGKLFYLVHDLENCSKAWVGPGWRKIHIDDDLGEALEVLKELVPNCQDKGSLDSYVFGERDLTSTLEAKHDTALKVQFSKKGRIVGIRFYQKDPEDKRRKFYNEEIPLNLKRDHFLPPDENEV